MLTFDPRTTPTTGQWQIHDNNPQPAASHDGTEPAADSAVSVTLSAAGMSQATQQSNNKDIEDSGLPPTLQQTLKIIRQLKKQLADKMAELQALASDKNLTAQQRQARMAALQTAINAINAAMIIATASLAKSMKELNLSPEQVIKVGALAAQ
ncbi:hypothetical protein PMM47T1_18925 [Pseudomonas sp. M47T1]|uniref:hypothetical protein n=1 Tax=Pseudomonas sp. M47T1 TaxID=1179778 RepID=UPI0002606F89|nr:hypothetical protein [Pseudomonas sp. M47T1]EIK95056.1 hypothetical protein PMM47T1_18925 [Pseudomonas sp. M47T1]